MRWWWRQGEAGRYNHVNKARCDGGRIAPECLGAENKACGRLTAGKGQCRSARCCDAAGLRARIGTGLVKGCRLWTISACRPCRAVSWCRGSGRLQTDSDGIPYHAGLGRHAADMHPHPHQNPHPQSTHQSINRSVGQSISSPSRQFRRSDSHSVSQQVGRSVGRSRQIESYRVGGRACLHHAARRSLKSPPAGLAHYRCRTCCVAVMLHCFDV